MGSVRDSAPDPKRGPRLSPSAGATPGAAPSHVWYPHPRRSRDPFLKRAYGIRTVQGLLGHKDVKRKPENISTGLVES